MAAVLEFIGQSFKAVPPDTASMVMTIHSDFPTIANAGVKVFKDNGDGTISQVGQAALIDTSINTPQGDNAIFSLHGPGNYAMAFQGQATSINGDGVKVDFTVTLDGATVIEDFGGPRSSDDVSALINGTAFVTVPTPGVQV